MPLAEVGRVGVGPYYTNTREGLRLARRILDRQRKDMRQIIMITDGKPSALTQPAGRIYKNPFGLAPFIVAETCSETPPRPTTAPSSTTSFLPPAYPPPP